MIEWINAQCPPNIIDYYLIEYIEYYGINTILGYKIVIWDNGFDIHKHQRVKRYAKIPYYINFKCS